MPSDTAQAYQASVNPSRRAKVQSSTNASSMLPSPPLDPVSLSPSLPPSTMTTTTAAAPSSTTTPSQPPAHQPSKRGRKPNPLSRSARETQRKLNHSIIEKARRTKINEALAELRTLVPVNWGREGSAGNAKGNDDDMEDDDEGEDGEDDAEYNPRSTTETRSGGKRQSRKDSTGGQNAGGKTGEGGGGGGKEKEFKLEILERTVGYLKEVLGRARELEREVEALRVAGAKPATMTTRNPRENRDGCSRCTGQDILERQRGYEASRQNEKRKRASLSEEEEEQEREERPSKRFQPISSPALSSASTSSEIDIETPAVAVQSRSRLPSISSWLPSATSNGAARASISPAIDPILFTHPRSRSGSTSPRAHAYLPSPPSSTQFNPIHAHPSIGVPPKLNLSGPIVVSPMSKRGTSKEPGPATMGTSSISKGGMTPEDEFAASSLLGLQIGMERRRRSGSLVGSYGTSGLRSTSSNESPSSESPSASLGERGRERRVQTPGSLLGLIHPVRRD